MHAGCAVKGIHFQPRIIRQHRFSRHRAAVLLRLLARIVFEREPILHHRRQCGEVWNALDLDAIGGRSAGKIAELSRI